MACLYLFFFPIAFIFCVLPWWREPSTLLITMKWLAMKQIPNHEILGSAFKKVRFVGIYLFRDTGIDSLLRYKMPNIAKFEGMIVTCPTNVPAFRKFWAMPRRNVKFLFLNILPVEQHHLTWNVVTNQLPFYGHNAYLKQFRQIMYRWYHLFFEQARLEI